MSFNIPEFTANTEQSLPGIGSSTGLMLPSEKVNSDIFKSSLGEEQQLEYGFNRDAAEQALGLSSLVRKSKKDLEFYEDLVAKQRKKGSGGGIGGFLSGALGGASAGSALGPWGAAGGAVLGGVSGLFG